VAAILPWVIATATTLALVLAGLRSGPYERGVRDHIPSKPVLIDEDGGGIFVSYSYFEKDAIQVR
jgi:hypothetical protein